MAAPTTANQILRRFILPCPGYAPLRSPSVPRCRLLPLAASFAFSSLCSSQFLPTPSCAFSRTEIYSERDGDAADLRSGVSGRIRGPSPPRPPSLSVKEKKELASYANSLGKKLKSQQVGKSGITDTVVSALCETLEANELLKLKIHGTCPGEFEDVVNQLEKSTGSVVVGQIGRTVILYRPSLTKLKEEEKRKHAQRVNLGRPQVLKLSSQSKKLASLPAQEQKRHGRGRRGSSRF